MVHNTFVSVVEKVPKVAEELEATRIVAPVGDWLSGNTRLFCEAKIAVIFIPSLINTLL
jgi:hypothetical protein